MPLGKQEDLLEQAPLEEAVPLGSPPLLSPPALIFIHSAALISVLLSGPLETFYLVG